MVFCVLLCTLWVSGAFVALTTNEYNSIGLDLTAIAIAYKWAKWLLSSWAQLSFSAYDYLKLNNNQLKLVG